jgi:aerobic-type carbon monoxide dehydrogenase small subunit (CoxS/CutS family)
MGIGIQLNRKIAGVDYGGDVSLCGALAVHMGSLATGAWFIPIRSLGECQIASIEGIGVMDAGAKISKTRLDKGVIQTWCPTEEQGHVCDVVIIRSTRPSWRGRRHWSTLRNAPRRGQGQERHD